MSSPPLHVALETYLRGLQAHSVEVLAHAEDYDDARMQKSIEQQIQAGEEFLQRIRGPEPEPDRMQAMAQKADVMREHCSYLMSETERLMITATARHLRGSLQTLRGMRPVVKRVEALIEELIGDDE